MHARLRRALGPRLSPTAFDAVWITGVFVATRAVVLGSMLLVYAVWGKPDDGWNAAVRDHLHPGDPPPALLAPFARWDALFYVAVAREGYPLPGRYPAFAAAFFPLYPAAVRAVDSVVGETFTSAMIVSALAALGAALAMYALARSAGRRRYGRAAALILLTAPGAHFLSLPYSESLFCLLVALGLLAVERDRPGLAAMAGALASATRPTGVVVALAIAVRALQRLRARSGAVPWLLAGALACGGLAAYAAYCNAHYGDAFYFAKLQRIWGRETSLLGPVRALIDLRFDPDYYLVTIASLVLAVMLVRARVRPTWTVTAWALLLVPLSTGSLKSMIRFQSANVPLIAGAPQVLRRSLPWVLGCGFALQLYEACRFALGFANN